MTHSVLQAKALDHSVYLTETNLIFENEDSMDYSDDDLLRMCNEMENEDQMDIEALNQYECEESSQKVGIPPNSTHEDRPENMILDDSTTLDNVFIQRAPVRFMIHKDERDVKSMQGCPIYDMNTNGFQTVMSLIPYMKRGYIGTQNNMIYHVNEIMRTGKTEKKENKSKGVFSLMTFANRAKASVAPGNRNMNTKKYSNFFGTQEDAIKFYKFKSQYIDTISSCYDLGSAYQCRNTSGLCRLIVDIDMDFEDKYGDSTCLGNIDEDVYIRNTGITEETFDFFVNICVSAFTSMFPKKDSRVIVGCTLVGPKYDTLVKDWNTADEKKTWNQASSIRPRLKWGLHVVFTHAYVDRNVYNAYISTCKMIYSRIPKNKNPCFKKDGDKDSYASDDSIDAGVYEVSDEIPDVFDRLTSFQLRDMFSVKIGGIRFSKECVENCGSPHEMIKDFLHQNVASNNEDFERVTFVTSRCRNMGYVDPRVYGPKKMIIIKQGKVIVDEELEDRMKKISNLFFDVSRNGNYEPTRKIEGKIIFSLLLDSSVCIQKGTIRKALDKKLIQASEYVFGVYDRRHGINESHIRETDFNMTVAITTLNTEASIPLYTMDDFLSIEANNQGTSNAKRKVIEDEDLGLKVDGKSCDLYSLFLKTILEHCPYAIPCLAKYYCRIMSYISIFSFLKVTMGRWSEWMLSFGHDADADEGEKTFRLKVENFFSTFEIPMQKRQIRDFFIDFRSKKQPYERHEYIHDFIKTHRESFGIKEEVIINWIGSRYKHENAVTIDQYGLLDPYGPLARLPRCILDAEKYKILAETQKMWERKKITMEVLNDDTKVKPKRFSIRILNGLSGFCIHKAVSLCRKGITNESRLMHRSNRVEFQIWWQNCQLQEKRKAPHVLYKCFCQKKEYSYDDKSCCTHVNHNESLLFGKYSGTVSKEILVTGIEYDRTTKCFKYVKDMGKQNPEKVYMHVFSNNCARYEKKCMFDVDKIVVKKTKKYQLE